ncbi:MAG: hypothetical protein GY869_13570, partial [Planctomycetes bacterium]|nr:hypothetical protein [Planctomycetota bacterium]
WGVDGWARRAGQGAYFDWMVGNAILPPVALGETPAIDTYDNVVAGTTKFILIPEVYYKTGKNYLEVFVNDVKQKPEIYSVSSDSDTFQTVVTFNSVPEGEDPIIGDGDTVEFRVHELIEGIQKIDRTTVLELAEIADNSRIVQVEVDKANIGLNPLGLTKDSVPFDIDPGAIANGETHFEQIYGRAVQAMNNAIAVFNHANQSTQLLRHQQDTLTDFKRNIENSEADFNNRLIEVYGYPYPDDCGPGKTYPSNYNGPDLYHYMYVDPSELMGVKDIKAYEFELVRKDYITEANNDNAFIDVDATGTLKSEEKIVTFHIDADSRFGLIKPP